MKIKEKIKKLESEGKLEEVKALAVSEMKAQKKEFYKDIEETDTEEIDTDKALKWYLKREEAAAIALVAPCVGIATQTLVPGVVIPEVKFSEEQLKARKEAIAATAKEMAIKEAENSEALKLAIAARMFADAGFTYEEGKDLEDMRKELNQALINRNNRVLKLALKELKIPYQMRKVILRAAYKKVRCAHDLLWKVIKDLKNAERDVIISKTLVPAASEGSKINTVTSFKADITSDFIREIKEENGFDEDIKSGMVGQEISFNRDSQKAEVEGGYLQEFGKTNYSYVIKDAVYIEFGLLMEVYGNDHPTFTRRWNNFKEKGFLMTESGEMYENTSFNRRHHKDAKLFVFASTSDSALKSGTVLFVSFDGLDYNETRNKIEELRNNINCGSTELLAMSNDTAKKKGKRHYSMGDARGVLVGSIDLTKESVLAYTEKWVDQKDIISAGIDAIKENIDKTPIDGLGYIKLSFAKKVLNELLGLNLSDETVLVSNLQMRIYGISGKLFCKVIPDELFEEYVETARKNAKYRFVGNSDNPVLLGDANCLKLINEFLSSGKKQTELKLLVLDVAHYGKSLMNLNIQLRNKTEDMQAYNTLAKKAVRRELEKELKSVMEGEKEGQSLTPYSTVSDLIATRKGRDAIFQEVVQKDLLASSANKAKPIIKKGKAGIAGCMLALSMEEGPVIAPDKFDNMLTVGKTTTEVYSNDMLYHLDELFEDGVVTDFYGFKMPSAGKDEHIKCSLVTLEELCCRIAATLNNKVKCGEITLERACKLAEIMVYNFRFDGDGTITMANINIAANKLAGLDKDFDKIILITEKDFVAIIDAKGVNNATVIGTEKKVSKNSSSWFNR